MKATRRDFIGGGVALFATATLAHAAAPAQADCRRLSDGRLELSWSGGAADIRLAERPDGPFATLVAKAAQGRWSGAAPISPRPYFRLVGASGSTEIAERLLPLEGGRNFRDMGGYRAADGRMVRWGQLYRSGSMVDLTRDDYTYLDALGIKVICDFRTNTERTREPTRWVGPGMISRDYETPAGNYVRSPATDAAPTAESVRAHMLQIYEEMPYEHADSYRRMFAELVAGRVPLAFNCSGGKDRTGIGAGLLLTALGVPRATVLVDYGLTEKIMDFEAINRRTMAAGAGPAAGFESMSNLSPAARAPMLRSDPAYLQRAFQTIERREGSIAGFLDKRVGVSSADVRVLRERLLKRV